MTANQGAAAALPMHMLRPPAYPDSGRNPRGSIPFTLALLRHRERTREQLGDEHANRFADRSVDTTRMLRHLTRLGHILEDDQGLVGITPEGEKWLDAQLCNTTARRPAKARMMLRKTRATALLLGDKLLDVIAPAIGGRARTSSDADNRTPPMRLGADQALSLPSRIGDQLHYRSGLITDMAGNVVQPAHRPEAYRPTHTGGTRARPVFASNH